MKAPARQRLSTEERQDEIVKAAVDLAVTQGMDNVTTQGIADVVGITQGAIFRHFPTKETIWIAVVHWVRARLLLTTNPQLKRLLQEFLDGYETKLAGLLADAKALGLTRSDLDEEAAASLFIGIIQGLVIRFLALGPRRPLSDEAKRLFPIFLAGIGASEP